MSIEHHNHGVISSVIITSTVFEFRKHNRAVDTALYLAPGTIVKRSGMFFMKSVISGKSRDVLRAHKVVLREAIR